MIFLVREMICTSVDKCFLRPIDVDMASSLLFEGERHMRRLF